MVRALRQAGSNPLFKADFFQAFFSQCKGVPFFSKPKIHLTLPRRLKDVEMVFPFLDNTGFQLCSSRLWTFKEQI